MSFSFIPFQKNLLVFALIIIFATVSWSAFTFGHGEKILEEVGPDGDSVFIGENNAVQNEAPLREEFFPGDEVDGALAGTILFDQSHNSVFGGSFSSTFSFFISHAQSLGFSVVIANDFNNMANYDVYMMVTPRTAYSVSDVNIIRNFLNGGGTMLIMGEWPDFYAYNYILNNLMSDLGTGIQILNYTIEDPVHHYGSNNIQIYAHEMSSHCLANGVSEVFHPATAAVSATNPASVIYSSDSTSFLRGLGTYGPHPIAAVPNPATHPNWQLVLVGDTSHFSSFGFSGSDNDQLATNELLWCDNGCTVNADCDDGLYCNGAETCDTYSGDCVVGTAPCADDGLFCSGVEGCNEAADTCTTTGNPCPNDGLFCNGVEGCNEAADSCTTTGNPCPDDNVFCNGTESCNEANDTCSSSGNPCPDDGAFCNGVESCNEVGDTCTTSGNPCPDDGAFCNGAESCNEIGDTCATSGNPCPDDGVFCNGTESCNEVGDTCSTSGNPCPDDGAFCNGVESCDETGDTCATSGNPCPDDGVFCNGTESCNEAGDTCATSGNPCPDDGLFCNGTESCDETADSCLHSGTPCPDDNVFCNGQEGCDENSDVCLFGENPCPDDGEFCNGLEQCDEANMECTSAGEPCLDDGLFCNGSEFCDEEVDECMSTGDPCPETEICDEGLDECSQRELPDDDDSGVVDDDDDDDNDEDLWPEGSVSGGSDSNCCGC